MKVIVLCCNSMSSSGITQKRRVRTEIEGQAQVGSKIRKGGLQKGREAGGKNHKSQGSKTKRMEPEEHL